jgi:dihydropteroate synthase
VFPTRQSYLISLPGGRTLALGPRPLVMGILNVTPDSFAECAPLVVDGIVDVDGAVDAAVRMEAAGADLVDVGGESTRPGAQPLSEDEEYARVVPVIRALASRLRVPISVDTYKAAVARAALAEGAALVNDISGLHYDPALAAVVANAGAALILMHSRGRSNAMYDQAAYQDLVGEVAGELRAAAASAVSAGVPYQQLLIDPGVGFAKRPAHSYGVLARLAELASALDRPVLVGPSRKSFMRDALGERTPVERDWGTAAAVAAAVLGGAHVVRVHAVPEMVQVVRVAEEVRLHQKVGQREEWTG